MLHHRRPDHTGFRRRPPDASGGNSEGPTPELNKPAPVRLTPEIPRRPGGRSGRSRADRPDSRITPPSLADASTSEMHFPLRFSGAQAVRSRCSVDSSSDPRILGPGRRRLRRSSPRSLKTRADASTSEIHFAYFYTLYCRHFSALLQSTPPQYNECREVPQIAAPRPASGQRIADTPAGGKVLR